MTAKDLLGWTPHLKGVRVNQCHHGGGLHQDVTFVQVADHVAFVMNSGHSGGQIAGGTMQVFPGKAAERLLPVSGIIQLMNWNAAADLRHHIPRHLPGSILYQIRHPGNRDMAEGTGRVIRRVLDHHLQFFCRRAFPRMIDLGNGMRIVL